MISLKNTGAQLLFRVLTWLFSVIFAVDSVLAVTAGKPQDAPADFTPVVRFAVCSDVHLNGEENQAEALRFGRLFDVSYAYAEKHSSYQTLDAVLVAGDFTAGGGEEEYQSYNRVVQEHIRRETQLLAYSSGSPMP